MSQLDQYVKEQLQKGMSIEEIAGSFATILNNIQEERNKLEEIRTNYKNGLLDNITAALDTDTIDFKTAASAATIYMLSQHPEWGTKETDHYYSIISDLLEESKTLLANKSKEKEKKETKLAGTPKGGSLEENFSKGVEPVGSTEKKEKPAGTGRDDGVDRFLAVAKTINEILEGLGF